MFCILPIGITNEAYNHHQMSIFFNTCRKEEKAEEYNEMRYNKPKYIMFSMSELTSAKSINSIVRYVFY